MDQVAGEIWLIRHGETPWSLSGQHTSHTDLELTEHGKRQAAVLGELLAPVKFGSVFSSPMKRALDTCSLCGLKPTEILPDLQEWNYGDYEGLTTPQIREVDPNWAIWTGFLPHGETREQVSARADRALSLLRHAPSPVAVFSHGHFLRILAARWIELEASHGRSLALDTGSVSVLGFERGAPVIRAWNNCAVVR